MTYSLFVLLIITWFGLLTGIVFQKPIEFCTPDSNLCIHHLLVQSNLNFLHYSYWTTFLTQLYLVLYSFLYLLFYLFMYLFIFSLISCLCQRYSDHIYIYAVTAFEYPLYIYIYIYIYIYMCVCVCVCVRVCIIHCRKWVLIISPVPLLWFKPVIKSKTGSG